MGTLAAGSPFVSFDFDGCLVDSTVAVARAMNQALTGLGMPALPSVELVARVGPPLEIYAGQILKELAQPTSLTSTLMAAYLDAYAQRLTQDTTVFEGIVEQLELLHELDLVVVTMKRQPLAVRLLEHLGLRRFFASVQGSAGGEPGKLPLLRAVVDERGHGPAVMVGDTTDDVRAAQMVGLGTVAVSWGFGDRAELAVARPDALIDRVDALAAAVLDTLAHRSASGASGIT